MANVIVVLGSIEKGVKLVGRILGIAVLVAQLVSTASEHSGQKQEA